jgi:tripartite-type tricarboxylate transporter receptor subunit TctC
MHRRSFCLRTGAAAAGALLPGRVSAQNWPARAIRMIVPFPPGGGTDVISRQLAERISNATGWAIAIENRAGAGGNIGLDAVAKAAPDGYTLLMTTIGPAVLRPLIDSSLHYDAVADFTPISLVGEAPNLLASSPKRGFNDVRDLVAYAKRNPGQLSVGHSGPGTMGHLIGLLFASEAGIDANLIAYAGSPPIIADLAGGHIDAGSIAFGSPIGAAKVLAVTTKERLAFLPDVPTMAEAGFPNVTGATWSGLFGPIGMPPEVVARLNRSIADYLDKDEVRRQFEKVGYRIVGGPAERLRQQMIEDRAKWSKVITAAKLGSDH